MTHAGTVRVAVDAVGGDRAPEAVLGGVSIALDADPALHVFLAGPEAVVEPFASAHDRCEAVVARETIGMGESAAQVVRTKKDSSIVVGCRLVKEGGADAFFSAGNTGACMAAATLTMGRISGIHRPAIATIIPTAGEPVVLLDVGANADCKPEYLLQFGHMGALYAETVLGVTDPRIALLNIGEEATKGSQLAVAAHELMVSQLAGFVGNVEGRDVTEGVADVIVTDGFTGNVVLKVLEGVSKTLLGQVKDALTSNALTSLAAVLARPSLKRLKNRLDPDTYGGAPLLGVNGVCIIGHGSSSERAVSAALGVAATAIRGDLTGRISRAV